MRRREFIVLVGSSAAWSAAARGQTSGPRPLVGFLSAVSRERSARMFGGFEQGMRELGFVDGKDIEIVYRFADGHLDQLPHLAKAIVELNPRVVLAAVTAAAAAMKEQTNTIPIVCPLLGDPIRLGLIESVAHPGGNVTGVSFRIEGLVSKQLELALQLVPTATKVGFLVNVATPVVLDREEINGVAQKAGVTLVPAEVRGPNDLKGAFDALAIAGVQAVVVQVDALFFNERQLTAELAAKARLPTVYGFRDHVDAGGLLSYGVNLAACFHRSATYVVNVLKGAKPGELPVEFPTKLELVINLRAAKALDLSVPPTLLAIADEVIE
jgi:putative tryptophan/tyrosine transport system substrate-binding protein